MLSRQSLTIRQTRKRMSLLALDNQPPPRLSLLNNNGHLSGLARNGSVAHDPEGDIGPDQRLRPVVCHFSLAARSQSARL